MLRTLSGDPHEIARAVPLCLDALGDSKIDPSASFGRHPKDRGLSDKGAELLALIVRMIEFDGGRQPTLAEMAEILGINQAAVKGRLRRLADYGWIHRANRSDRGVKVLNARFKMYPIDDDGRPHPDGAEVVYENGHHYLKIKLAPDHPLLHDDPIRPKVTP